jgi:hypothetical protein
MSRTVPSDNLCDSGDGRDDLLCGRRSLDLARSTARRSYSSHNIAVFLGVHGGVLGSVKGDVFLASGEDWCGANVEFELIGAAMTDVHYVAE